MKANLVRIFGYDHGGYLMAKMTPLLMLRTMMTSTKPGTAVPVAKADDSRQAKG
jgi:hypothetical protein